MQQLSTSFIFARPGFLLDFMKSKRGDAVQFNSNQDKSIRSVLETWHVGKSLFGLIWDFHSLKSWCKYCTGFKKARNLYASCNRCTGCNLSPTFTQTRACYTGAPNPYKTDMVYHIKHLPHKAIEQTPHELRLYLVFIYCTLATTH